MKRFIIITISIIVVLGAIYTAIIIMDRKNNNDSQEIVTEEIANENILDDCTDEYEEIEKNNMMQANSEEEKVSPNCSFTQKTYYEKCGHIISNYLELPNKLVNLSQDEVKKEYPDYQIEEFASNKIVLSKHAKGECGEHYLVKDNNGKVTIYQIIEDGSEKEIEETDIYTEYLTETDKINMKNGIKVNGKQELNQLIEDFE